MSLLLWVDRVSFSFFVAISMCLQAVSVLFFFCCSYCVVIFCYLYFVFASIFTGGRGIICLCLSTAHSTLRFINICFCLSLEMLLWVGSYRVAPPGIFSGGATVQRIWGRSLQKLKQFADIVYIFWPQKRSKFDKFAQSTSWFLTGMFRGGGYATFLGV